MIEVRMRDQHQINRRKVLNAGPWLAQALQNEKPACEIGINHHAFTADLQEKGGVADECYAHLPIRGEHRLVRLASAGRDCGVPDQLAECPRSLPQPRILECLFEHEVSYAVSCCFEAIPSQSAALVNLLQ